MPPVFGPVFLALLITIAWGPGATWLRRHGSDDRVSRRIEKIRAGRSKPGLMRQHLTAVEAAATVGGAHVEGATVGSQQLRFEPGAEVRPGRHTFAVGTADSAGARALVVDSPIRDDESPDPIFENDDLFGDDPLGGGPSHV